MSGEMMFVPEDEPNVDDMLEHLNGEIASLLAQLKMVGAEVQPYFRADVAIQTLVQFLFETPEESKQFHLANNVNVRNRLRAMLDGLT